MIGTQLTRYALDRQFLTHDWESEGLNLFFSRPWELSYSVATLRDGVKFTKTAFIKYKDRPIQLSDDAARVTRFNRDYYEAHARPAEEVWDEFSPLLYSTDHYSVFHNGLGFDTYMVSTLRAALGLPPDHSWNIRAYDTFALSKTLLKQWVPDISTPEAFLAFQFRALAYREKGLKGSLGHMARYLGVPYDEAQAHAASYDIGVNLAVFRELIFKLEI